MKLISCEKLSINYGRVLAVDEVTFSVKEKDYLFIVGENGSGKSSLLKAILKLKPYKKGDIIFDNLKMSEIGYLPQKSGIQKDFPATVYEVVISGFVHNLKFWPFYDRSQKKRVFEILNLLNLYDFKSYNFNSLSKGQQQKVLLARAICAAKKILFLDEPCASLDPVFTKDFYKIIKKLNEEQNLAIVMVSHDVNLGIKYAKKILHIKKRVIFFGDVDDYSNSKIGRLFLKGEQVDKDY